MRGADEEKTAAGGSRSAGMECRNTALEMAAWIVYSPARLPI
jgi:hypothetical protein